MPQIVTITFPNDIEQVNGQQDSGVTSPGTISGSVTINYDTHTATGRLTARGAQGVEVFDTFTVGVSGGNSVTLEGSASQGPHSGENVNYFSMVTSPLAPSSTHYLYFTVAPAGSELGTFYGSNAVTVPLNSSVSGAPGPGSLTVPAGTTTTISTMQSYTGKTQVAGELDLAAGGSVEVSSQLSLKGAGAVFDASGAGANGAVVTIQELSGVAGSSIRLGAGLLSLNETTAAIYAGAITDVGVAGGTGGGLQVNGSAALTLTGADSYTGKTQIYGELDLAGAAVLNQSKAVTLKSASAVFDISGATGKEAILNLAGVAGSHIYLGANTLKINDSTAATFSGVISDGGAAAGTGGALIVKGTTSLNLTGANTFTGGVTLQTGALELGSTTAAGVGHALTFTGPATLQLDAGSLDGSDAVFSYGTAVAGFAAGDHIDLASLTYATGATAVYNGSTLTVTSSGSTVALTLAGPPAASAFTAADDGHGHLLVGLVGG